ncbi:zinc finger, CCHC-type containing protein [Tanacetum coccineum]
MDEAISVVVIIDKLPRNQELDNNPKGKNQIGSSSINMVEGDGAKNSNNNKNKRKFKSGDDKFTNKKATVTCWKCNKTGHIKKDCRSRKGNGGTGSNGSKDPEKQQGYNYDFMQNFYNVLHYVSVIFDTFYVQDDEVAWWVDSGATSHVCKDLREKGIDCIFIGYAEHSKCYKFYVIVPNDYVSVNSIIESRDAIFDEDRFTSIPRPRGMIQPSSGKIAKDEVEVEGTRDKTLSQREYCFIIKEDPRTLSEAMASSDVAFWKEAVQSEIDSIMHNDTWELTNLPPGCKTLGSLRIHIEQRISAMMGYRGGSGG